jgi:hypothetical protein
VDTYDYLQAEEKLTENESKNNSNQETNDEH